MAAQVANSAILFATVGGAAYIAYILFGSEGITGKVTQAFKDVAADVGNLGCSETEEYDAGLCYPKCREGYDGVGPYCWAACGDKFKSDGGTEDGAFCGKATYSRGVGTPIHTCGSGYQKDGLLCYSNCDNGYYPVGPLCWEECQPGYTNDGATCRRNTSIISADTSECPWYDACGLTLASGCSKCPAGYKNDGCTCRIDVHVYGKKTRARKAKALSCDENGEDYDTGLCYKKCKNNFEGVGPICWEKCPPNTKSNGISCTKDVYGRGVGKVIHQK